MTQEFIFALIEDNRDKQRQYVFSVTYVQFP